ncbi:maltose alpha-D-glucosyltransferase/alpha-amylase [Edaphobacter modestus]|uniref:Maltokinase n=1 Tax=Edaphobacter modestus TaxID=388466 RepID=A0A4Q7YNL0_9BACT|nr:maltose alpha-D-glucosyltransferase/alpha-amylase [Edaphobacter modestus]
MIKKPGSAIDPLWYKDAIIYELPVKAFADSNGDGIGDFPGLMGKLDYLQDLGITCIWLLPFFPSPLRDDGYDIANYVDINPHYGTLNEFKAFLNAAHQRGMQVMIELVINHTSDQHPWFQAARRAPAGSPERDMYVWSDTDRLFSGVRIIFTDTEKSNWTWDDEAGAYYWHRFFSHQPDLNFDNPRVLDEVLRAMRLWFDMGVDGLRLDAIPYLVERDGTSCENLDETHQVIRKIRQAIDAEYENRLVLAEANMWPADVRPYFGDGDECHMAFHFPLMPRIYMALRQEDRLPITEIMAQTPEIPENCQWGLFLRNHDELTLEMVTDDERDYMYFAYSADPRMRINVGIRRRLAPLVDNNRRRIELLNSILFSFPGTPILYYGDEIGMGDNIYLGDRNGVRTPMQWNGDRNAGFSRCVPAKLYSPVIMDPIWGYQAINVEAQESDTSSLLHWTRNMIALRKLFQVFGRGTLEFLKSENRKVLAYIREYRGERVLCVANLSRFAQPVSLDLDRWEGMVPVEMLGYVPFPIIKKGLYSLTLGPYAFLWLEFQDAPKRELTVPTAAPEVVIPADDMAGVLSGPGLELLQESVLPKYLSQQRWFGSKARTIQNVIVADWVSLPIEGTTLLIVDVCYTDGEPDRYTVPVALRFDVGDVTHNHVLGNVRCTADGATGLLLDALSLEELRSSMLAIIRDGTSLTGLHGRLLGSPGKGLDNAYSIAPSRLSAAEQSNSSILFGDSLILKLFRRVEEGINPDVEIGRALTEDAAFANIPAFAGQIIYKADANGDRPERHYVIALLQGQVHNRGDGWTWTLDELTKINLTNEKSIVEYLDAARLLAIRTAQMHMALANLQSEDFAAQPASSEKLIADADRLRAQIRVTLSLLRQKFGDLGDENVVPAASLLAQRDRMTAIADRLASIPPELAGQWIRIHGDYHLGQVLRTENDFTILDFEGEPVKALEERRKRQSPLRDVAGMLRSFSYVAAAFAHVHPEAASWINSWERSVHEIYLDTYISNLRLPLTGATQAMLAAYLLEKALYELQYELNHRPDWLMIPLQGILQLIAEAPPSS